MIAEADERVLIGTDRGPSKPDQRYRLMVGRVRVELARGLLTAVDRVLVVGASPPLVLPVVMLAVGEVVAGPLSAVVWVAGCVASAPATVRPPRDVWACAMLTPATDRIQTRAITGRFFIMTGLQLLKLFKVKAGHGRHWTELACAWPWDGAFAGGALSNHGSC